MMKRTLAYSLIVGLLLFSWSCASWSKTKKGAAIGATSGAVVGGLIGKAAGNTIIGAILMEGHTDSTGPEDYNLTLSKERAEAVAFYLAENEVGSNRFSVKGYGEVQPIATNDTAEGRQQNRRVDVAIMANDKLKKVAVESTKGTGPGAL
jgi:outer membrane protein OmpA-like peptidoglycan-associated protein